MDERQPEHTNGQEEKDRAPPSSVPVDQKRPSHEDKDLLNQDRGQGKEPIAHAAIFRCEKRNEDRQCSERLKLPSSTNQEDCEGVQHVSYGGAGAGYATDERTIQDINKADINPDRDGDRNGRIGECPQDVETDWRVVIVSGLCIHVATRLDDADDCGLAFGVRHRWCEDGQRHAQK